ncbi:MAG: hypothetical protein EON96_03590 [Caulobacteraceae bacterium]|nr:MAG: hypothetical protein EON96_03590 [Caulobacteraceae bacterium]
MPATARASCQIPPLPAEITFPALKAYAATAAAEILRCDIARQLGVDTHDGEHSDEDAWRRTAYPDLGESVGGRS